MNSSIRDYWKISAFRLATFFGVLFTIGNIALLAAIYWQISLYLEHRIDRSITTMSSNFQDVEPAKVLQEVDAALTYDLRKSTLFGLFTADGTPIASNLKALPPDLLIDGEIHQFNYPELTNYRVNGQRPKIFGGVARGLVRKLSNGELLVVGRDFTELAEIESIIMKTLVISGTVIIALGLAAGFWRSLRSLNRISAIRSTSERIVQGELSLRIPSSERHDELDMLASIVNLMLDEIERLLTEVKGVTDTLAHDLRTPLTRLRLMLYRTQSQSVAGTSVHTMLEQALSETDALLVRFRALLRISEIENLKRQAGFDMIDPRETLTQIAELFEPLAEEKSVQLQLQCDTTKHIHADRELLFEGVSNLVDNAIKFTPQGGIVTIKLSQINDIPRIEVIDTGSGIEINEQDAVLKKYYRGHHHREIEGHGLGLSIVAAIMHLHGFSLTFQECEIGTHITILCEPKAALLGA